jgi:hypothetical protein
VGGYGVEEDGKCAEEQGGGVHAADYVKVKLVQLWREECCSCSDVKTMLLSPALICFSDVAGASHGFQSNLT